MENNELKPTIVVVSSEDNFIKKNIQRLRLVNTFIGTLILVAKLRNVINKGKKEDRSIVIEVNKEESKGE